MSKFTFTINDDGTAYVTVNGEERKLVKRIFIYGEPLHHVITLEEYVTGDDGGVVFDRNKETVLTESTTIEFDKGKGYVYETRERNVKQDDCRGEQY